MKKTYGLSAALMFMILFFTSCSSSNVPVSSSVKAITAYSINGVAGTIDETAKTISVILPSGTDLNGLVATFTTTGFNVKVGLTVQTSGKTPNDFPNPVTYTVTASDGPKQDYIVTVATEVYQSFILSNEDGGLINQLVANGYSDFSPYQVLVAIRADADPSTVGIITDQFLATLASCPAGSEIFTTHLRDYLDSTPQSVTAVSKAAVMRAGISINLDVNMGIDFGTIVWTTTTTAYTFILSNEGGGLISQLVTAGYGDYNLYQTLVAIQQNTDPSISGVVTDDFLNALASCPAGGEIFTHKLSEYTGAGLAVAISTDGTVQTVSVYGRTYLGTTGSATLKSNISGVGDGLFTYTTLSSPLTSFSVSTTTYNVFAIGWAPGTTAALAISTDCTVQVVNIYGSAYDGKTGTATLNSAISGIGSADFTYTTDSQSPLIRWIVTGKAYDAFAIGWMPTIVSSAGTLNGGGWVYIVAH